MVIRGNGENVWTAEEREKHRKILEEQREWAEKVRERRRRRQERKQLEEEYEEEVLRRRFLESHQQQEESYREMLRQRECGRDNLRVRQQRPAPPAGPSSYGPPDCQFRHCLPSPYLASHNGHGPSSLQTALRSPPISPPRGRDDRCFDMWFSRRTPSPRSEARGPPTSPVPVITGPPRITQILLPARGPIPPRGLRMTSEWRNTRAVISREVDEHRDTRISGSRVQKSRQRRKERQRLRRAADTQIMWFDREVRKLIARFPMTQMEGKPPVYDYMSAMCRESTQKYRDWAERISEHAARTMTVWRYNVMDQVRRLQELYMDNTARYVLHVNVLGTSPDSEDRIRALRLKEEVTRQHEEFLRFMRSHNTRRMLRPLTHQDMEMRDRNRAYYRKHPGPGRRVGTSELSRY